MPRTESKLVANDGPHHDRLVESIYRIALQPQTYDSFMGEWDAYISEQLAELATLRKADTTQAEALNRPEITAHFEIAEQLLDQIGRPDPRTGGTTSSKARNFQILVDTKGQLVWTTAAATELFALPHQASIDDLALESEQAERLYEMAAALEDPATGKQIGPLVIHANAKGRKGQRQHLVAQVMTDPPGDAVLIITKVAPEWPPAMTRMLREGYALSPTEIEICEQIADGRGAGDIAELRGNAVSTVRTQIKSIMAKTHSNAQSELVRLMHSIMRVAEQNPDATESQGSNAQRVSAIVLPGRTMPVDHFGNPDGYPVIFLHGMLDGTALSKAMQEEIERNNLHLICPIRPYFGNAAGRTDTPENAPERYAQDLGQMITHMQLEQPILLGHMAGSIYANAAASTLPQGTFRAILNVSGGVPILSIQQFATMSKRQRLVAYTSRFTPAILPFVLRAGVSQIDNGGGPQFLHSLYESAPDDLAMTRDPETRDLVLSGYRFATQQGHRAFEADGKNVVKDWTHLVTGHDVPIHLLHGESDPVVSASSVRDFAARHAEKVTLEVMENTGQLLFYRHPGHLVRALCALRDGEQPETYAQVPGR